MSRCEHIEARVQGMPPLQCVLDAAHPLDDHEYLLPLLTAAERPSVATIPQPPKMKSLGSAPDGAREVSE